MLCCGSDQCGWASIALLKPLCPLPDPGYYARVRQHLPRAEQQGSHSDPQAPEISGHLIVFYCDVRSPQHSVRRRHAISPEFSGHYHDLGISSLKGHDSACNFILRVPNVCLKGLLVWMPTQASVFGQREFPHQYPKAGSWVKRAV